MAWASLPSRWRWGWPPVRSCRRRLLDRRSLLLLAAAMGALLPFMPFTLGLHGRHLYIACPFFFAWLLRLVFVAGTAGRPQVLATSLAVLLCLANIAGLNWRIWQTSSRPEALRGFVATMRQVVASHPDRPVAVLLQGYDVEHSLEMLVLQGICRPAQLARTAQWMPDRDPFFRGKNPPPPPPGSLLTVCALRNRPVHARSNLETRAIALHPQPLLRLRRQVRSD